MKPVVEETADEKGNYEWWCPGCQSYHSFWHRAAGRPSWSWNTDLVKPTVSPSILTRTGPKLQERCHVFLKAGKIQYLGDCTHDLAGKTVDMIPVDDI